MTLLMAINIANQINFEWTAAVKMYSFPKNPAVIGRPRKERRNRLSAAAVNGWRVAKPAKSSTLR